MALVEKECVKCNEKRRFALGSERDEAGICGECWDWGKRENLRKI